MSLNAKNRFVSTDLKILYWNFRSINARKLDLVEMMLDFDVVVGVETWLNSDIAFPNFNVHAVNRVNQDGGGVIFIVKKHIEFQKFDITSSVPGLELGAIKITSVSKPFNLVVCYRPPLIHLKCCSTQGL